MRILRLFAICLVIVALPGLAQQAAAPANPLSASARGAWDAVKNMVLRSAEKMPEENYAFKPVPEVRSFGQIIAHIADAQFMMCSMLKGVPPPGVRVEGTKTAKADLIAALKDSDALCDSVLADLTDAKAVEPVKMFGREQPRLSALYGNIGHSFEHYGNLVTYLRIKGIVPPSSEPRTAPPKAK